SHVCGHSLIPVPSICRIRLLFLCRGNALTGDVDRKKLEDRVNTEQPTQIVDKGYAKIASPVMPYPLLLNSRRDRVHRQIPHDHDEGRDQGHTRQICSARSLFPKTPTKTCASDQAR